VAKVFFNYADRQPFLRDKRVIKDFTEKLFIREKKRIKRLDYIFCSDSYLLNINKKFLSHDYYTDIITFDLSENKREIKGEVYISIDRVKENAEDLNVSFEDELLRVLFHGALHLCGHKDKTKSEANNMRSKEDFYLHRFKTFHKTQFR